MELKALFWTIMMAGLLAVAVLLFVVSEQMDNRRPHGAGAAETDSVCLTCASRP